MKIENSKNKKLPIKPDLHGKIKNDDYISKIWINTSKKEARNNFVIAISSLFLVSSFMFILFKSSGKNEATLSSHIQDSTDAPYIVSKKTPITKNQGHIITNEINTKNQYENKNIAQRKISANFSEKQDKVYEEEYIDEQGNTYKSNSNFAAVYKIQALPSEY